MRNFNSDLSYMIQQINHSMEQMINERLESEGVSTSQARVLYHLYTTEGSNQREIQTSLSIKSSSLTKLIDILEKKQLVIRKESPNDSRVKLIFLTEKGKEKEKRLWQLREETETFLSQSLTPEQKDKLIEYLGEIKGTLN
ncbi:MarR family winged helix-turn-helix transcriptional regulator [Alkalicoccobacillus plakortidis]|uniref:MarR family transcriptional regulator n=1 Tax=Alkalicoccobacillus plakortidis TaxID=444060 RepID=A0ABT0XNC2_9BACI|nr:MarR family transcriptional regulator [Alkalicoccobacillus plakortidis]MCM2677409.1 MarR family transcriptional regulator [Alkalicoccobacillus plakortidis]